MSGRGGASPHRAPYGTWPSPFTAELVVSQAVSLGEVLADEQHLWWSELRPAEKGRVAIVRRGPGGQVDDVLPEGFSARTRVHEYGGGAWCLHDGVLFFANADDQRLHRFDPASGDPPRPITPEPERPAGDRYADGRVTPDHEWLVCVRERHTGAGEPANELVAVATDGGSDPVVLVTGVDFVAAPRVSPDGEHLCWLQWNHPDMPWDATELWAGRLVRGGGTLGLVDRRRVAGGPGESVVQPAWSPGGTLHLVSDRDEWWNVYRAPAPGLPDEDGAVEAVTRFDGEVGTPPWVFGQSRYAFLADGSILCAVARDGLDGCWVVRPDGSGEARRVESPFTSIWSVQPYGDGAVMIAASPEDEPAIVIADPGDGSPRLVTVHRSRDLGIGDEWISRPEPFDFTSTDGETAHALFYAPRNPEVTPPDDERPPLIVTIHGGPTSAARPLFNPAIQFWTTRGFAVVDVNYRGSTGYGRAYRQALRGRWGEADVADCVAAAGHLADAGRVDPDRLVIRGGSAGGFTALCALTFHDRFSAAAVLYGIADLETLAHDTHKFEARYTDGLVGPYPAARELYVARSPIHHTDRLSVPIIVLHGSDDAVVPPNQAEALVAALDERHIPYAYLVFEGEQHGFRQAQNIRRALEAELSFYCQVFGIDRDEPIEPVPIANL